MPPGMRRIGKVGKYSYLPGSKYGDLNHLRFGVIGNVHMIIVTHFTAVANFQFLQKRYIVERKLHWYSEAFQFHENQPMVNTMLWPSYIN